MSDTVTFARLGQVGRLGNQLWQIASTVGLAAQHGLRPLFPAWDYDEVFNVPPKWFVPGIVETGRVTVAPVDVRELATAIDPWCRDYLQHLPFITPAEEQVRAAFTLTDPAMLQLSDYALEVGILDLPGPVCAVHVRRGDVLTNPPGTINVLPARWYERMMTDAAAAGARSFAIFTDDEEWAGRLKVPLDRSGVQVGGGYQPRPSIVVSGIVRPPPQDADACRSVGPSDWPDMMLMAGCDMHILSNATYGWWGAWLANGGPVWYPWPWVGPKFAQRFRHNVWWPDGWIRQDIGGTR